MAAALVRSIGARASANVPGQASGSAPSSLNTADVSMDFDPVFLTVARATIAALLGIALLVAAREKLSERGDVPSLVVVAIGVVIEYPLLSGLAL